MPRLIFHLKAPGMSLKESVQRCLWMLVISAGLAGCSKPGVSDLYEGQKALENGDLQKATASFRQATQLLATPARAWNYLGLAYQRDGQYIQARDAFMQALKHDEKPAACTHCLAVSLWPSAAKMGKVLLCCGGKALALQTFRKHFANCQQKVSK